jgi:hypothetical protein
MIKVLITDLAKYNKGEIHGEWVELPTEDIMSEVKRICGNNEFFISDQEEHEISQTIGFCQLFTVRSFDGEARNACSKFCMKAERNIS